ncbi:MAG: dTDP-4-dehydrorhamnose reductase [FCB group bacterium]|jgi:dTDP-4-dehydrorhamnose reductase
MKYLIIGNKGQLGKEFEKKLILLNNDFLAVDIDELDISNNVQVKKYFNNYKPDIALNCSAYNFVDKAEEEPEAAFKTNIEGVRNLALASKEHNFFLVHYSSDYVFDGTKNETYVESDSTNPINIYGESKLAGEKYIQEELNDYLLFRLSWVFGEGQQNFIYKFRQWAEKNHTLKISVDEISVPTYTKTIVDVTLQALEKKLTGLYHLTNSGYCSRYEWAKFIAKTLSLNNEIIPVSKDSFNLPAPRPAFSAMSNDKISQVLQISIPGWEEAVGEYLKESI